MDNSTLNRSLQSLKWEDIYLQSPDLVSTVNKEWLALKNSSECLKNPNCCYLNSVHHQHDLNCDQTSNEDTISPRTSKVDCVLNNSYPTNVVELKYSNFSVDNYISCQPTNANNNSELNAFENSNLTIVSSIKSSTNEKPTICSNHQCGEVVCSTSLSPAKRNLEVSTTSPVISEKHFDRKSRSSKKNNCKPPPGPGQVCSSRRSQSSRHPPRIPPELDPSRNQSMTTSLHSSQTKKDNGASTLINHTVVHEDLSLYKDMNGAVNCQSYVPVTCDSRGPNDCQSPPQIRSLSVTELGNDCQKVARRVAERPHKSVGSGPPTTANQAFRIPTSGKVFNIIQELIETETQYLQSLDEIRKGYLERLLNEKLLDEGSASVIFCNLSELCQFHKHFLTALQSSSDDCCKLSNCFMENAENFQLLYSTYCTNYTRAMKELESVRIYRSDLWNALCCCQCQLGHQLPLNTYLLKPVQRILRYQLLLQELCKRVPPNSLNHSVQSQQGSNSPTIYENKCADASLKSSFHIALETMTAVAEEINEAKRLHETAMKGEAIKSKLLAQFIDTDSSNENLSTITSSNNDLHNVYSTAEQVRLIREAGELLLDGELTKLTGGGTGSSGRRSVGTSKRVAFLFRRVLVLGKSKGGISQVQNATSHQQNGVVGGTGAGCGAFTRDINWEIPDVSIKEIIKCSNLMIVENIPKDALAFHLISLPDNQQSFCNGDVSAVPIASNSSSIFTSKPSSSSPSIPQLSTTTLQTRCQESKKSWCRCIRQLLLQNYHLYVATYALESSIHLTPVTPNSARLSDPSSAGSGNFFPLSSTFREEDEDDSESLLDGQRDKTPTNLTDQIDYGADTLTRSVIASDRCAENSGKSDQTRRQSGSSLISDLFLTRTRKPNRRLSDIQAPSAHALTAPSTPAARCPPPSTSNVAADSLAVSTDTIHPVGGEHCPAKSQDRISQNGSDGISTLNSLARYSGFLQPSSCTASLHNMSQTSDNAPTPLMHPKISASELLQRRYQYSRGLASYSSDTYLHQHVAPHSAAAALYLAQSPPAPPTLSVYDRCMELLRNTQVGTICSHDLQEAMAARSEQNSVKLMTSSLEGGLTNRTGLDGNSSSSLFNISNTKREASPGRAFLLKQLGDSNNKFNSRKLKQTSVARSSSLSERSRSPRRWVQQVVAGLSGNSGNSESSTPGTSKCEPVLFAPSLGYLPSSLPTSPNHVLHSNRGVGGAPNMSTALPDAINEEAEAESGFSAFHRYQKYHHLNLSSVPSSPNKKEQFVNMPGAKPSVLNNNTLIASAAAPLYQRPAVPVTVIANPNNGNETQCTSKHSGPVPRAVSSHPNLFRCGVNSSSNLTNFDVSGSSKMSASPATLSSTDLSSVVTGSPSSRQNCSKWSAPTSSTTVAWPSLVLRFLRGSKSEKRRADAAANAEGNNRIIENKNTTDTRNLTSPLHVNSDLYVTNDTSTCPSSGHSYPSPTSSTSSASTPQKHFVQPPSTPTTPSDKSKTSRFWARVVTKTTGNNNLGEQQNSGGSGHHEPYKRTLSAPVSKDVVNMDMSQMTASKRRAHRKTLAAVAIAAIQHEANTRHSATHQTSGSCNSANLAEPENDDTEPCSSNSSKKESNFCMLDEIKFADDTASLDSQSMLSLPRFHNTKSTPSPPPNVSSEDSLLVVPESLPPPVPKSSPPSSSPSRLSPSPEKVTTQRRSSHSMSAADEDNFSWHSDNAFWRKALLDLSLNKHGPTSSDDAAVGDQPIKTTPLKKRLECRQTSTLPRSVDEKEYRKLNSDHSLQPVRSCGQPKTLVTRSASAATSSKSHVTKFK